MLGTSPADAGGGGRKTCFNDENASTRRIAAKVVLLSPVPDDSVVWRGGSMECSSSR